MSLFSRRKELEIQSLMLKLVNNHCAERDALVDGPRLETRVDLTIPVQVVPCENGKPRLDCAFTAVTKELSTTGMALILDAPLGLDEVIIGLRWETEMKYLRAKAIHLNPMGGGFYHLGLQLKNVVRPCDYPGLDLLVI